VYDIASLTAGFFEVLLTWDRSDDIICVRNCVCFLRVVDK